MINNTCLVFDIEILSNDLTPEYETFLEYKVRNVAEKEKERKKLQYRFRLPAYSRVCSIATLYNIEGDTPVEQISFDRYNEEIVIKEFINYISQWQGRFVGFNSLDFDVPYILFKCAQYNIIPPTRFCNLIRFRTNPHYDIMQILSAWGKFPISLAEALSAFNIENSKELLHGLDTLTFLQEADDAAIIEYNRADVRCTYELFKKVHLIYQ